MNFNAQLDIAHDLRDVNNEMFVKVEICVEEISKTIPAMASLRSISHTSALCLKI